MDVCFFEAFAEEAEALRRLLPPNISATFTDATVQESALGDMPAAPARIVCIRTQSRVPERWAASLDAVLSRSTGYDHLTDLARRVDRPIPMGYLPLYCHRAVAEQTILLLLALMRKLPRQIEQFRTFDRDGLTGREIAGRTLVVVGVGHIGREVCVLGRAIGMRVLGVDIDPRHAEVEYTDIDAALPLADAIVCAMDLTDTNRGYFDATMLARCTRRPVFINIARGELSPSSALLAALESGVLSGVALDVFDHEAELAVSLRAGREPTDAESIAALGLSRHPLAICTPHNAFNTAEAVERKSEHTVQQIAALLETGSFIWNVPR